MLDRQNDMNRTLIGIVLTMLKDFLEENIDCIYKRIIFLIFTVRLCTILTSFSDISMSVFHFEAVF